jgi:GxxExxY protein
MCIELTTHSIPFECERAITVSYRGVPIAGQRVDLIVANAVIVELKAVTRLDPVFQAKLISYLRTTGIRVGLLINFNVPLLREGIKRLIV